MSTASNDGHDTEPQRAVYGLLEQELHILACERWIREALALLKNEQQTTGAYRIARGELEARALALLEIVQPGGKELLKIYCFVEHEDGDGDVASLAVCAACGRRLAGHLSSNVGYAKHDIGMSSNWKHDIYQQHCAEHHAGQAYELEWIDNPATHAGLQALKEGGKD